MTPNVLPVFEEKTVSAKKQTGGNLNVEKYLKDYGHTFDMKNKNGADFYCLKNCVFDSSHVNEAAIVQNSDGKLTYQCFHDSCSDKKWTDAKLVISGIESLSRFISDDEQQHEQSKPFKILSGEMLQAAFEKSLEQGWIIQDIIPASMKIGIVYGAPGSFKSFLALDMCLCIATGAEWHDKKTKKTNVLYVAAEGQAGILRRWFAWHKHHELEPVSQFMLLPNPVFIDDKDQLTKLKESISELTKKPDLVVIDTLSRSMTGDENSTKDMCAFIQACDVIDAAVLVIHHSGKDISKGARGNTSLSGAADTVFRCEKKDDLFVKLKCEKQKDFEPSKNLNFEMVKVDTGFFDNDGVVVNSLVPQLTDAELNATSVRSMTGQKKIAYDCLKKALSNYGEKPDKVNIKVFGERELMWTDIVVQEDKWRGVCSEIGLTETGNKEVESKAFRRARLALVSAEIIRSYNGYYWIS